jgi:hypothetical protein
MVEKEKEKRKLQSRGSGKWDDSEDVSPKSVLGLMLGLTRDKLDPMELSGRCEKLLKGRRLAAIYVDVGCGRLTKRVMKQMRRVTTWWLPQRISTDGPGEDANCIVLEQRISNLAQENSGGRRHECSLAANGLMW